MTYRSFLTQPQWRAARAIHKARGAPTITEACEAGKCGRGVIALLMRDGVVETTGFRRPARIALTPMGLEALNNTTQSFVGRLEALVKDAAECIEFGETEVILKLKTDF